MCSDTVTPVWSVWDLGIYGDSDLSMSTSVMRTVTSCYTVMRQIRNIRRSVNQPVLCSLVVSLILTWLDYGSALLAGLPRHLPAKVQSVLNAAVHLVFSARNYNQATPLRELHWLQVSEPITFRLAVLVYRCLHGLAPLYLAAFFTVWLISTLGDDCDQLRRRHWSSDRHCAAPLVTAHFPLLLRAPGTVFFCHL